MMTATKSMVPVGLAMVQQEVQTVSGRSICDISDMICRPADTRPTTLKQLDGFVTQ